MPAVTHTHTLTLALEVLRERESFFALCRKCSTLSRALARAIFGRILCSLFQSLSLSRPARPARLLAGQLTASQLAVLPNGFQTLSGENVTDERGWQNSQTVQENQNKKGLHKKRQLDKIYTKVSGSTVCVLLSECLCMCV